MKKVVIIMICILIIIPIMYIFLLKEDKVPILTYHNIVKGNISDDSVDISKKKFEKQIRYLHNHGYKSMSMDEFYKWKRHKRHSRKKNVLITFDDGWDSFYNEALPILEKYNMKAAIFVIWGSSEASSLKKNHYLTLEEINDIRKNHPNIDVLSHSYGLHFKNEAKSNDYNLYKSDMERVKKVSKKDIKYYAYPYGYRNKNYIKALKDSNYKLAFTFGPYDFASFSDNDYEIPRIGVYESTDDTKLKLKLFLEM